MTGEGRSEATSGPLVATGLLYVPKLHVLNAMSGSPVKWFVTTTPTSLEYTKVMVMLRRNRRLPLVVTGSSNGEIQLWSNEELISPNSLRNKVGDDNDDNIANLSGKIHKAVIEPVLVLKGHRQLISSLIELADGTLLSSSSDRTIRLWDTHTGECLWVKRMGYEVETMVLLSDGRSIAVSCGRYARLEIFRMTWLRFHIEVSFISPLISHYATTDINLCFLSFFLFFFYHAIRPKLLDLCVTFVSRNESLFPTRELRRDLPEDLYERCYQFRRYEML